MEIGYPEEAAEMSLLKLAQDPSADLEPVMSLDEFVEMRRCVWEVHASEAVLRYVVSVTSATRERDDVSLGASPRASRMLLAAAKAGAAASGRSYCIPDDIKAFAPAVLGHRIIPSAEARQDESSNGSGRTGAAEKIVHEILGSVPVTEAV
jgi:MoxR-like ATPase